MHSIIWKRNKSVKVPFNTRSFICVWGALEWTALQWVFKHKLSSRSLSPPSLQAHHQSVLKASPSPPLLFLTLGILSQIQLQFLCLIFLPLKNPCSYSRSWCHLAWPGSPGPSLCKPHVCFALKCSGPCQVTPTPLPGFSAASRHSGPSWWPVTHSASLNRIMSVSQKEIGRSLNEDSDWMPAVITLWCSKSFPN